MKLTLIALLALFTAACALPTPPEAQPAEVTYLGNEGIMVSDGKTKLLFDPLYPRGFGVYQMVPDDMLAAIMAGTPPFDNVDAIFFSHMHPDHFSVEDAITYLETHPETQLYAPEQAIEWMREETDPESVIFTQVTGIELERLETPVTISFDGIDIDAVRIPHAGWPGRADISNLVFRVTLRDGATVMHMGDADVDDEHYAPHADHWTDKRTDTAFPPYWFFQTEDGNTILTTRINAEQSIGIHVPIEVPEELIASGADYLSVPGETRELDKTGE